MEYEYLKSVKLSQKGQVTIPSEVRKKLGVENGDFITFGVNESGVLLINNKKVTQISDNN